MAVENWSMYSTLPQIFRVRDNQHPTFDKKISWALGGVIAAGDGAEPHVTEAAKLNAEVLQRNDCYLEKRS